ncbi:flagellar basal body-associated FliL family protein [Dissulfurimicrobium hydrothermale]|nr:flagellar basal body-associated FliL family protein [Dissulfurimicrobium hydrothermale]UKL13471.1 flagellar basal body-associated FliL family protein [Dissulfurimicrobium hydrothermale]
MAEQEEKVNATETDTPKKKKNMLLIAIIGLIVVIVLAGLGSYLFLFKKPSNEALEREINGEHETKGADKGKVGIMVDLEPFVVNLDDPKARHFLKIAITLEVPDEKAKEEITKLMPKIKNEIIMILSSKSLDDVIPVEGKIKLRDELMVRLTNILGQGRLNNVYFSQFVVQ